jgi:pantoate kinase
MKGTNMKGTNMKGYRIGAAALVLLLGRAEVGDVQSMAQRILRLLREPKLRKEMAESARFTAETRFCSTLIIPQYEEYYRRVLA